MILFVCQNYRIVYYSDDRGWLSNKSDSMKQDNKNAYWKIYFIICMLKVLSVGTHNKDLKWKRLSLPQRCPVDCLIAFAGLGTSYYFYIRL